MRHTRPTRARGFTLVELLFTLAVVAVLIGLISVGVWGARQMARGAGDQFTASGLGAAAEQFKNDFGFMLPLVVDGDPLRISGEDGPITTDRRGLQRIALRDPAFLLARSGTSFDTRIRDSGDGGAGAGASYSDKRYSKLSLTYYLMGACSAARDPADAASPPIDGVPGAGFRTPLRDGRFEPAGRSFEPFYAPRQADRIVRGYAAANEFREHGANPASADPDDQSVAIVDAGGVAFRYYRWTNGRPAAAGDDAGDFMNVPKIFQNPHTWGDDGNTASGAAAGAAYAIVGPGPDGLFGTEPAEVLERAIGNRASIDNVDAVLELRRIAQQDNVVEFGR